MINTWEELFEEIKGKEYAKKINAILNDDIAKERYRKYMPKVLRTNE